ncbi:MAG: histidine phosphatase family protein [Lachnospiraceae bacterium]|nr:histidine phosphatase family protein [Lachnospiraceae bacterium]
MMELVFIRHGKTAGNLESRYIGTTDEGLCREGIREIKDNLYKNIYPAADIIFTSPMKRCIQTAEIIYPGLYGSLHIIDEFKEIDFGKFEGKNYTMLKEDARYQEWIGSGGAKKFPGGEDRKTFSRRCIAGFKRALKICTDLQEKEELRENAVVSFIVHGGTIMSVLEAFAGEGSYFNYQCSNGHGYRFKADISIEGDFKGFGQIEKERIVIL